MPKQSTDAGSSGAMSAVQVSSSGSTCAAPIVQVCTTSTSRVTFSALSMQGAGTSSALPTQQPSTSSAQQTNSAPNNSHYSSTTDSDEVNTTPDDVSSTASTSRCTNPKRDPSVAELVTWWRPSLLQSKLGTKEQCLQFAEERGLIPKSKMCETHKKPMTLGIWGDGLGIYRCRKSNCRQKGISRSKGTFFENSKLDIVTIFQLMYYFCHPRPYLQVQLETIPADGQTCLSTSTICDWFSYCRESVLIYELENSSYDTKIGGQNKVVQIDESKFGKRSHGKHIQGHWVIGMIEDGSEDLRLEMCPDNKRSSEVLIPLIKRHVAEGSIIHTDNWRAYDCLTKHGYVHQKANHSEPTNSSMEPDQINTHRIRGHWNRLKRAFQNDPCKGSEFADWLVIYNWRRKIRLNCTDPYEELLKAVKYAFPASK